MEHEPYWPKEWPPRLASYGLPESERPEVEVLDDALSQPRSARVVLRVVTPRGQRE